MAEIEEKKEEKKVRPELGAPIPSVEEMYNADTPQGAALRKLYNFQDGMMVAKKEQDLGYQAIGRAINRDLQERQTAVDPAPVEPEMDPELKQSLEPLNQAEKSYDDIINGMIADRDAYQQQSKEDEKRNDQVQFFGGLAEAAAAITNLIGTTKGAVSQKWESPQPGWAARIDALKKERDTKLQNYKTQLATLEQAKNQVTQKKASVISTYNTQKETTARSNARIQASADLAIAKAQEAAKVKLAKNGADGLKTIANNANRLLLGMIKQYGDYGTLPTEKNMKRWSELAYNAALAEYKDDHPEDFEDTILP